MVRINRRGDTFRVVGAQATNAEELLRELFALTATEEVTPERVHLALRERESGSAPAEDDARDNGVRVPRGGFRGHDIPPPGAVDTSGGHACGPRPWGG